MNAAHATEPGDCHPFPAQSPLLVRRDPPDVAGKRLVVGKTAHRTLAPSAAIMLAQRHNLPPRGWDASALENNFRTATRRISASNRVPLGHRRSRHRFRLPRDKCLHLCIGFNEFVITACPWRSTDVGM